MIKVKKEPVITDMQNIVNDYQFLHFDEEPILFSGLNLNGDVIIGSSVDEDSEEKIQQYIHCLISAKQYNDFLKKKISYLDIIKNAQFLFLINISFGARFSETYLIKYSDIPKDHLPAEDSYCSVDVE